jgi:methanol---5-hydroxybenzimidazolylcobamide Co-methyltransferase
MPILFSELAITNSDDLVFGRAPHPVSCGNGLVIGGGEVYPEVNFTLPAITVEPQNWTSILDHYREMVGNILKRAVALQTPGLVLEFELLPAMTEHPEWGAEITNLLSRELEQVRTRHGLRCALRVTPTDIRDQGKPPALRSGEAWERLRESVRQNILAGASIISIESVGGKEVHDQGLLYGDLKAMVFALGVLAPRDMAWLWSNLCDLCEQGGALPGGDTACGFANTAMQLAHQKMLPEVLAAVVRAMSAARSLVAFEQGACGPSKDCAYEGPVLKAITGYPISMEGKSATCAHFSPVGNIAAAACDLWSNESVQNVRLLSGNAPEAYAELLVYDCRLMNAASARGQALMLREWMTESDEWLSPQAAVLSPEATLRIARAVVSERDPYRRTVEAGMEAVGILQQGLSKGCLKLSAKERTWLDRIERELGALPPSAVQLRAEVEDTYGKMYAPASYGWE